MTQKVQRIARGFNNLLSISGGVSPNQVLDDIRPVIDLLQLYSLQQVRTETANDAALAENGVVTLTVPTSEWWIVLGAHATVVKTATVTALRLSILMGPPGASSVVAVEELSPFGATETGTCRVPFVPPFPRVLPPGSTIQSRLEILGTDATANVSINAQIGALGN